MSKVWVRFMVVGIIILLVFPQAGSAQKEVREGLLWRITGKGLAKPSYLYGTMHLTDPRIFNFGDSLYAALEKSEGYAMELNPDSLMMEYFNNDDDNERLLLKDALSQKDFIRIKKKLSDRFKKPAEKVTVKEFRNYFRDWVNLLNEKGSMQTFMDAYFYDIARRQGKWVGGIEDVADQKYITQEEPLESYLQDFLHDNRESRQRLEEMIRIYNADDLRQVQMMDSATSEMMDTFMLRRNIKMARRIDSLAHIRNIFFAIGTLHLPGDSGVINLLRRRGFIVEPVISSKRIHAENYKFVAKELPWVKVNSGTGLYSVEMPGEPHNTLMAYDNLDMKMYADISTNLYYLSMGSAGKKSMSEDSIIKQFIKRVHGTARIVENKPITRDSILGKEVIVTADNVMYRLQLLFHAGNTFLLLVGSPADKAIYSADAERFLRSFSLNKNYVAPSLKWQVYNNSAGGFYVSFPGKPVIKRENKETSNVITSFYSALDIENDIFFQLLEQDMKKGYYLVGDQSAFNIAKDNLSGNPSCRLISSKTDIFQHYPAMWTEFVVHNADDSFYNKGLTIHRGNRIYYLFITAKDAIKSRAIADNFFTSFSFTPVKESDWSMHDAPDKSFSAWTPLPVERYLKNDNAEDKGDIFYQVYDSTSPVTFFIKKSAYPRLYWTSDDTTQLRQEVKANVRFNDSLLNYRFVTNGEYRGVEALIKIADNHNLKKMRFFIVGDTLFTLYGITAKEFIDRQDCLRFFDDFRVNHSKPVSKLYTNKAKELLQALTSTDSATFAEADYALNYVKFTKDDLPLLHKAMLRSNADSADYNSTNDRLFKIIASLNDISTVPVAKQAYEQLPAYAERMRFNLLYLLASPKNGAGFMLVKDLYLAHPPKDDHNSYSLFRVLKDTLQLSAAILPELLPLLRDSVSLWNILSLAEQLLDSGYINKSVLLNWKNDFTRIAESAIVQLRRDKEYTGWYENENMISLMGKLHEQDADIILKKYLQQPNLYLKQEAAIGLLKNDQPVPPAQLTAVAVDRAYRINLYRGLKKINKENLFPKQYLTQQALAESEFYDNYSDEDYEIINMNYVGERMATWKGAKKKFYLFRIDMSTEDDQQNFHLGIIGPYSLKYTQPETDVEVSVLYDERYNAATMDADFRKCLEREAKARAGSE